MVRWVWEGDPSAPANLATSNVGSTLNDIAHNEEAPHRTRANFNGADDEVPSVTGHSKGRQNCLARQCSVQALKKVVSQICNANRVIPRK